MKIKIMSRRAIEKYTENPITEDTAIISITDFNGSFAKLKKPPKYLLQIKFDDVDNDVMVDELGHQPTELERKMIESKYNMFSDEQARELANFYHSVADKSEYLICQCEHGQSRSAAVAAAILEYRSRKGIRIFSDDRYYPNKIVFRKVFAELSKTL